MLAADFRRRGETVSVVNAGLGGYSTVGNLQMFDWWFPKIPRFKARYFLFYVGINDSHRPDEDATGEVPGLTIRSRSALYGLAVHLRGMYRARYVYKITPGAIDPRHATWTEAPKLANAERAIARRLESYERRLRLLIERTKDYGGVPIVVTQQTGRYRFRNGTLLGLDTDVGSINGQKINGVDSYRILKRFNERALDVCRSANCIPVDLATELVLEGDDFYDFIHTTPAGSAKIGHYLYSRLNDLL